MDSFAFEGNTDIATVAHMGPWVSNMFCLPDKYLVMMWSATRNSECNVLNYMM